MNPLFRLFIAISALFVVSCSYYDKNYREYEAKTNANPHPQDITGMWHRKAHDKARMLVFETNSLLFRPDGTGHYDSLTTGITLPADNRGTFRWKYEGGGEWSTALVKGNRIMGFGSWLDTPTRWRISGNRLLQHTPHYGDNHYRLWERVEE